MRETGASISVVAFNLHNWTTEKEIGIRQQLDTVKFSYQEAGRHPFVSWLYTSLLEKLARYIVLVFPRSTFWASIAVSKRSWKLLQWVKRNREKYDLIIAHNPPAFYAAAWLAEKTASPFSLDIEDYHPGEGNSRTERKSVSLLMNVLMKKASYVSFASPLIKKYSEHMSQMNGNKDWFVLNNTFCRSEFNPPLPDCRADDKLRLVWFSQFIDYGRGLEKILPALDQYRDKILLTLIGTLRKGFFEKEIKERDYIHCLEALPQTALHGTLSNYDIGLALEDGTIDLNRNICLTNKIWSYLLAGLYIVASETDAQRLFVEEHPMHGICTSMSTDILVNAIRSLIDQRRAIRAASLDRYQLAAPSAWENESRVLTDKWTLILP
jgi:glycosyltransferase involved in cell wall biosynthesis